MFTSMALCKNNLVNYIITSTIAELIRLIHAQLSLYCHRDTSSVSDYDSRFQIAYKHCITWMDK